MEELRKRLIGRGTDAPEVIAVSYTHLGNLFLHQSYNLCFQVYILYLMLYTFKIRYRVPGLPPVSYTHLDVYKRQGLSAGNDRPSIIC